MEDKLKHYSEYQTSVVYAAVLYNFLLQLGGGFLDELTPGKSFKTNLILKMVLHILTRLHD